MNLYSKVDSAHLGQHVAELFKQGKYTTIKLTQDDEGELMMDFSEGAQVENTTPPEEIGFALRLVDIVRFLSLQYISRDITEEKEFSDDEVMDRNNLNDYINWYLGISSDSHYGGYYERFLKSLHANTIDGDYHLTPLQGNPVWLVRERCSNIIDFKNSL